MSDITCPTCNGDGFVEADEGDPVFDPEDRCADCPTCGGSGDIDVRRKPPRRINAEPPGWEGTRATHERATVAFRPRRAVNLTVNALLIVLGGVAVGWLLGQVLWHVERANVAAPGTPVTWLPALTAIPVTTIGIWAVIRAHRTPDKP